MVWVASVLARSMQNGCCSVLPHAKIVEFLKLVFDSLSPPEDVDFDLFFWNRHDGGYLLVALALEVAQLDAGALLLGQAIHQSSHNHQLVVGGGAVERRVLRVGSVGAYVLKRFVAVVVAFDAVESEVAADGETERLDIVNSVPLVAHIPSLDECFLHNVLCLGIAQRDAQCQTVKLVLER